MRPKIGLVSGIGPLAGSDVLAKIFKVAAKTYGAVEDHEYPELVLINHGIRGVDNTGALSEQFEREVVDLVMQLKAQQASVIGIACNTAHLYFESIQRKRGIRLVNLIDEVTRIAADENHSYLLMTSSSSKEEGLYQACLNKYNVPYQETNAKQQKLLDDVIGLVMAHRLQEAGRLLDKVIVSAKSEGLGAVIAGCTELPLAFDRLDQPDIVCIDSNLVLANALTEVYYRQKGQLS